MKHRRHWSLSAATVVLALVTAGPAEAQTDEGPGGDAPKTGVWWQLNGGGGGLSLPPLADIPEDGLWISSGPSGDSARSALRFPVADGRVAEVLTLRVHQDSSTPGPAVALCAPADDWQPPSERPGPWPERAEPDCETFSAAGVVSSELTTIQFDLSGYEPGEDVDLVLTRVAGDSSSYVSTTFDAPTAADLRSSPPVSSGGFVPPSIDSPASSPAAPTASPAPVGIGGFAGGGTDFGSTPSGGGFDSAGALEIPTQTDAGTTGVVPAPPTASEGPATELALEQAAFEDAWDAARWAALVGMVLLSAWIAAIVSRRLQHRGAASSGFTLYRGAPPA